MDAFGVLTERVGYPGSQRLKRLFQHLMTPREAEMVASLPGTPDEVAARLKLSPEQAQKTLEAMSKKGLVFFSRRSGYLFPRDGTQFHDAVLSAKRGDPLLTPEFLGLFDEWCVEEWFPIVVKEHRGRDRAAQRVLPAYKAVMKNPDFLPVDDIREHLRQAEVISVIPCPCRRSMPHPCNHAPNERGDVCIQVNRSAEYNINRGNGKRLSLDEALAVIDQVEEDGLVHCVANWRTPPIGAICNCCDDCCYWWRPYERDPVPMKERLAPSRFQASVDQGLCTGCQVCVDRCSFGAIEMVRPEGSKKFKAVVDAEKCWGCGSCYIGCAPEAVILKAVRSPETIEEWRPGMVSL